MKLTFDMSKRLIETGKLRATQSKTKHTDRIFGSSTVL